jgi:D-alanine-D-alanine ligase
MAVAGGVAVSGAPRPVAREPADFGRVAVLYGGTSAERAVSLESGREVLASLQRSGVDAQGIDKGPDVLARLVEGGFTRAFIVLHGRGGEDGTLQGALETLGLPYTGSGVLGCALSMDKHRTKLVWQACGVPTPAWRLVRSEAELTAAAAAVGYPVGVKPVHEGSSIGVGRATGAEELLSAWWEASTHDSEVLVERWMTGTEYTVAILGEEVLPAIRLETPHPFYDYEAKYADGAGTQYLCPCGLPAEAEAEMAALSRLAFESVSGSGWGRLDLVRDDAGRCWFLDVNSAPGMTGHSLVPIAASVAGMDFDQLVWRILEGTLA